MGWVEQYLGISFHPGPMLVFGVFVLFGVLGGIIANRISWLPTISGFMALGFLIGPHGLSLVTRGMLHDSAVLTTIAMGLILYKLGCALHPKEMLYSRSLILMALFEVFLCFGIIFYIIRVAGFSMLHAWIVAAIAISSSPAVLVHVAAEMRAKGPVTDRAKSLIAINNFLSFMLFSMAIPYAIGKSGGIAVTNAVAYTVYRFAGAFAAGFLIAWISVRLARMLKPQDEHYRFSIVIGSITLTLGICRMLGFSALLAPLVLGSATRWFETSRHNLSRVTLGEGGDLFFIILFVFAGAKLNPAMVISAGLLPVLLVMARVGGKALGVYAAAKLDQKAEKPRVLSISLLLMPMASMALGLVLTASRIVPDMAREISAVIIAMIAILETIGPIATKEAFLLSGEAGLENEAP
ncbi:MAG: cation:proton antiporter [Alphaproteobacteria bacterium]|nr:cation:proton antiporter [Alphaproteobacteria bacterium]